MDVKNLLHQNFKLDDIGKHKVSVMEDKYVVNGIKRRMTVEDFQNYDLVFSCVDNMPFRKTLYEYSWTPPGERLFWIDGRCTSRSAAMFNSDLSQDMLSSYINESQAEGGCLLAYEKEENISHTLPIIIAGMMVQTFLNKMRGEKTSRMIFTV